MKRDRRYPEFVAVKMETELLARIRERARADDRTVSSYLRRLIASALGEPPESAGAEPPR